jgi:hypothetical protein
MPSVGLGGGSMTTTAYAWCLPASPLVTYPAFGGGRTAEGFAILTLVRKFTMRSTSRWQTPSAEDCLARTAREWMAREPDRRQVLPSSSEYVGERRRSGEPVESTDLVKERPCLVREVLLAPGDRNREGQRLRGRDVGMCWTDGDTTPAVGDGIGGVVHEAELRVA